MILFVSPIEQFPNHFPADLAGLSATNVVAGFPASNLLDYDPTRVFKSSGTTSVLTWNMGAGHRYFDVVSLVHSNVSYRATILIEESDGGVAWNTLYSGPFWAHLTGAQPVSIANPGTATDPRKNALERNLSFWRRTGVTPGRTHLRLTVTDPLTSGFSIGRLFVGKAFVPSTGWQYGSGFGFLDSSAKERTDRGALVLRGATSRVQASVKLEFLTKNEIYDHIYEFNYWRGSAREILACLDVDDVARLQKNTLYCTITDGRSISIDSFDTHSQTWILESIA